MRRFYSRSDSTCGCLGKWCQCGGRTVCFAVRACVRVCFCVGEDSDSLQARDVNDMMYIATQHEPQAVHTF